MRDSLRAKAELNKNSHHFKLFLQLSYTWLQLLPLRGQQHSVRPFLLAHKGPSVASNGSAVPYMTHPAVKGSNQSRSGHEAEVSATTKGHKRSRDLVYAPQISGAQAVSYRKAAVPQGCHKHPGSSFCNPSAAVLPLATWSHIHFRLCLPRHGSVQQIKTQGKHLLFL